MAKKNDSKEIILEKALRVFIKRGYNGTSLTHLCTATGFTKGALYHYFINKEDLYRQAVDVFFKKTGIPDWLEVECSSFYERVRKAFQSVDQSKAWIQKVTAVAKDDAILLFYTFLYNATRRFPEYQKAIDKHDSMKREKLMEYIVLAQKEGEIRKDIDPGLLAIELDALIQQLVYLRFVNPQVKSDKDVLEKLAEHYWLRTKRS